MTKKVQISFAGCGGMYHYYLGIAKVIQDNFILDNVIFGGVSGGCIPAMLLLLDHCIDTVHYNLNKAIIEESSEFITGSLFRYYKIMRRHVNNFLESDSYKKVCGRLFVSLTNLNGFKNEIVSEWDSLDDFINCIQCSSFIPMTFEPKMWYNHRNTRYIDGGITNNCVIPYPDQPCIYLTPRKWRPYSYKWFWCYSDIKWAEQLYMWGKEDATNNIGEFASLLVAKPNSFLPKEILDKYYEEGLRINECNDEFTNIYDFESKEIEMTLFKLTENEYNL